MDNYYYIVFCVLSFVVGACVGSFLNVLIYRIPNQISLTKSASHCTSCGKNIKFYDNIPLLSYLILRGKCRFCKQKFSFGYFACELSNAALWLVCALVFYPQSIPHAIISMLFISTLICVALIDFRHKFIPDRFHAVILILGVVACFVDGSVYWTERLIGSAFCLIFFGLSYLIARLLLKREGMGLGDVKLMTVCGLVLGIRSVFFCTLLASISASIVLSIITKLKNNAKDTEYPFAPFLSLAAIIALFVGDYLINAYLSLIT